MWMKYHVKTFDKTSFWLWKAKRAKLLFQGPLKNQSKLPNSLCHEMWTLQQSIQAFLLHSSFTRSWYLKCCWQALIPKERIFWLMWYTIRPYATQRCIYHFPSLCPIQKVYSHKRLHTRTCTRPHFWSPFRACPLLVIVKIPLKLYRV